MKNSYKSLVGKPEGKRPPGKCKRRWEDNIKVDIKLVECEDDWLYLAQFRDQWRAVVNTVTNLRIP
jgi:hypothetical protein